MAGVKDDVTLHDARLHEIAQRLGSAAAERLDVEATAAAVLRRLRERPQTRMLWWMQPAWLRAAAAVLVIAGGVALVRSLGPTLPPHPSHYVAEDLNGLSAAELRDVLSGLDQTLNQTAPLPSEPGLNELGPEQLKAVLRSLEG